MLAKSGQWAKSLEREDSDGCYFCPVVIVRRSVGVEYAVLLTPSVRGDAAWDERVLDAQQTKTLKGHLNNPAAEVANGDKADKVY